MLLYSLLCLLACSLANGENYTKSPLHGDVSSNETSATSQSTNPPLSTAFFHDDSNVVTTRNAAESKNFTRTENSTKSDDRFALKESHAAAGNSPHRRGYERDLMVVLPVMQGNTDLSHSNLQMLYTKTPITAIIGENSKDLRRADLRTPATTSTTTTVDGRKVLVKRVDRVTSESPTPPKKRDNDDRHPYTEFLFTKTAPKTHKSPLDYGYPESFKFVQELNELPKNHKPDWALADPPETDVGRVTTTSATKGDPFQMFESVKPLEINKLLSFKQAQVPVTDSIVEETATRRVQENTETPYRYTKRPSASKRPTKKPQKNKLNPQKLSDADLARFTSPATTKTTITPTSPTESMTTTTTTKLTSSIPASFATNTPSTTALPVVDIDEEVYDAARYTTLLSESTKVFLPTPYTSPSSAKGTVATLLRHIATRTMPTSTEVTITSSERPITTPHSTTTTAAAIELNFKWTNVSLHNVTTATDKAPGNVKPSELVSLTKILGENFISNSKDSPFAKIQPLKDLTTKSPFPADMLTNDMKNMLIALGILKSENEHSMLEPPSSSSTTTTTTTTTVNSLENMFVKREPVTPAIDPNSYVNFKKIPIDFERTRERQPVSDEMTDLLASFGLLPKKSSSNFANSILTRISRQHNLDKAGETNDTSGNVSRLVDLFPESMQGPLEDMGLLQPQALYNYRPHKNGHVFQPTIQLEKLGDDQKVRKINDAIETIRRLSKNNNAENLTVEELERQLENVTSLLKDENFVDVDDSSTLIDVDHPTSNTTATPTPKRTTTISTTAFTPRSIKTATTSSTQKSTTTTTTPVPTPMTTTSTTTTTEEDDHEFDEYLPAPVLSNSTSLKHDDVNYTSDESVISFVKFPKHNSSTDGGELNLIMNPPNPLSPEELQHLLEFNKNDVKRQQPNDTSTSSADTSSSSSSSESVDSSTRAMMTDNSNAPLPDLADSFGGGETASEEPSDDDLPTLKPNGLYFYLDWNTFLNVGEADRNPIRIRFSPRAGNARNFLPIRVP